MGALTRYLDEAAALLRRCHDGDLEARVERAVTLIGDALVQGRPLLVCGNGGSAADAMHIAGELVGRYLLDRRPARVIALGTDPAVLTAWSNDVGYADALARQVAAYGEPGGVLLGLSTSGNSANVLAAMAAARERSMTVIAMTGEGGGRMASVCDLLLDVPSRTTPRIQEVHACLYHYVCEQVEKRLAALDTKQA